MGQNGNNGQSGKFGEIIFTSTDPNAWSQYSSAMMEGQTLGQILELKKKKKENLIQKENENKKLDTITMMDPNSTAFQKEGSANAAVQNVHDYPEVKEYMSWRVKRNKKRLQRLQTAAKIIQSSFRLYLAKNIMMKLRDKKSATAIQKCFRGWLGRLAFLDHARNIWASLMIQRNYRGYNGRIKYFYLKLRTVAAATVQRYVRGFLARKFVFQLNMIRDRAASIIQSLCRRAKAREYAWRRRMERNNAIIIQRLYRGHLGRRKAMNERDKYIFSKSQSQGIEFGRQMLLEHKLHATKLQSDVTLLTQEKMGAEEQVRKIRTKFKLKTEIKN